MTHFFKKTLNHYFQARCGHHLKAERMFFTLAFL